MMIPMEIGQRLKLGQLPGRSEEIPRATRGSGECGVPKSPQEWGNDNGVFHSHGGSICIHMYIDYIVLIDS